MIDLHCHILPCLDDGPPAMETSLEMCRIAVDDGIHTIVATPHMLNGVFAITPDLVYKSIQEISEILERESIPLRILPGADIHVDNSLVDYLDKGELITVADRGRHLLLELPQDTVPREVKDLLFQLQLKNITPIITHPERNVEIQQNIELLNEFIRMGNLTQITAGSLIGTFGSRVQNITLKLLEYRMVHLVASDAHNADRRSPRLAAARKVVQDVLGPEETDLIFSIRPTMILEGVHVEPPEPLMDRYEAPKKKKFWDRFFSYS